MRFKNHWGAWFLLGAVMGLSITGCSGCNNASQQAAVLPKSGPGAPIPTQQGDKNWLILLDTSGSMSGEIENAKEAINGFLDNAPKDACFGFATFNGGAYNAGAIELVPVCRNGRELIRGPLSKVTAAGGTPLGAAIRFCSDKLGEQQKLQKGYGQFNLLVVTDGEAGDDLQGGIKYLNEKSEFGAPIILYTIGYRLSSEHSLAKESVWYGAAQDADTLTQKMLEAVNSESVSLDDLLKN